MHASPLLGSFAPGGTALVVGAGGIGSALADRLTASPRFDRVVVACRAPETAAERMAAAGDTIPVDAVAVDVLDEISVRSLAGHVQAIDRPLRLIICATGILHRGADLKPERRLEDITPDALAQVFAVNAFGPMLIAKHLVPLLPRRDRSVFAAISARVGSIGDNRLGGWYAYRASKAALNQFMKCTAIELKRRIPGAIVAALHPGTVDTGLSEPFRAGVPERKLFSPAYSAERLLDVIDRLDAEDSGGFFAWDGSRIPW
jgi:NAD(P)-dependent dehydrogenase (short-subunit alcohol dehydrogenase family)